MKLNNSFSVGIDLMGSEQPPHEILTALFDFVLQNQKSYTFYCFGTKELLTTFQTLKQKFHPLSEGFHFVEVKEVVYMDDPPLTAVRKKKNSSLCAGFTYLQEGKIKALVSAGNTGALVASAKHYLGLLNHVARPALAAFLPTKKGLMATLDVGATVEAKAKNLVTFAKMGATLQILQGIKKPLVGLLNIGREALKGTSEIQKAYQEMQKDTSFTFVGNIEGKEAFEGTVDVLVTDGFTGNVFLKTSEGTASLFLDKFQKSIDETTFENLRKHLHYSEYPGALLLGGKGLVLKCHGYSDPRAFVKVVERAHTLVQQGFQEKWEKHFS